MAFGYMAHYGYYIDPTGTEYGQVQNLNGININDCVLTDKNTKFFIAEADHEYSPERNTYKTDRTTLRNLFRDDVDAPYHGNGDWRYFSLFPSHANNVNMASDQDNFSYMYWWMCQLTLEGNYSPFTIVDQKFKGNPFRWCPKLCKYMHNLGDKKAITFVYLFNQNKLMDQNGALYTVGSTGLITQAFSSGNYVRASVNSTSYNAGSVFPNAYFNYYISDPQATATFKFQQAHISGHAGTLYDWIVWDDIDAVLQQANIISFFGFETGGYDYRSAIGEDPDPYEQLGEKSKTGGGGGTGTIPGIQGTPIPGVGDLQSVIDLGLISAYTPDASQVRDLANELWGTNFIQQISKVVNQPMDTIVTFHIVPLSNISEGDYLIVLGNYVSFVHSSKPSAQYHVVDCGSVTIEEIWGSYLDWKCNITLFLPFIGSIPLKVDDCIGKTISVKYIVDILTGACVAYVIRDDVVIATFAGNCAFEIPLTGGDHTQLITGMIGVAGAAITGIATGGMSAPVAATAATSSINVAMSKTNYQRSGGLGANTAYMGIKVPYITVYVPNQCLPEDQNSFIGYPSYITSRLGSQRGYTEVYKSHIHASGASDEEVIEIENLLANGVIIA